MVIQKCVSCSMKECRSGFVHFFFFFTNFMKKCVIFWLCWQNCYYIPMSWILVPYHELWICGMKLAEFIVKSSDCHKKNLAILVRVLIWNLVWNHHSSGPYLYDKFFKFANFIENKIRLSLVSSITETLSIIYLNWSKLHCIYTNTYTRVQDVIADICFRGIWLRETKM